MSSTEAATLPPAAAVPPKYSIQEGRHGTTMRIGPWSIASTKRSILNGVEIEAAEKTLSLPLPEMTFGNNSLVLTYDPNATGPRRAAPARAASGSGAVAEPSSLAFDTLTALRQVATGEGWEDRVGGGVLVSMAEKWSKGRAATSVLSDMPLSTKPVRPHDWTYSTCYSGHTTGPSSFQASDTHEIPLQLLARQNPVLDRILFYDDVALFEDELHDNGESILNVRIRVMPHSFFILSRLFVRVDNVLFRIFDVRVYHEFGSGEVIRECTGMEADYDEVKKLLPKDTDLSPLADANFVFQTLGKLSSLDPNAQQGKSTGTPRRGKPWPGLGRTMEVLYLSGESSVGNASMGIEKLAL